MRRDGAFALRTVPVPVALPSALLDALYDVRSAVNRCIPDWRSRSEESRFEATKRCYRALRERYPHLASTWAVVIANETSASLNSWDRLLRRTKRLNPPRWERLRRRVPVRRRLKASLHLNLYRFRDNTLDITLHPTRHVAIDLSGVRNPLFWMYGEASRWRFGLTLTDRALLVHFRIPRARPLASESVGVDVNMPSADFATSDGIIGSVDLRPVTRVQGAMARKRISVTRSVPLDLRAQRTILRRLRGRERNRVTPLLHKAANELLAHVGERNIILEDLSATTDQCMPNQERPDARRRLATWTHGQFTRLVTYKARTQVVRVNPRGTSSECPRCGGRLDHPEWRRAICGACQGEWHRDRAAAIAILVRGHRVLRGEAPPPRALHELLEASRWGSERGPDGGLMNGDEANRVL